MKSPILPVLFFFSLPGFNFMAVASRNKERRPLRGRTKPEPRAVVDTSFFQEMVTLEGVKSHLLALQNIANKNENNRAIGTPGFDLSVEYVMKTLAVAGYRMAEQEFSTYTWQYNSEKPVVLSTGDSFPFRDAATGFYPWMGTGEVVGIVESVDIMLPPGPNPNDSTSGCSSDDFVSFIPGNIALMQRGGCSFDDKIANARQAGAVAVIMFNEGQKGRTDVLNFSGGSFLEPVDDFIVIFASFDMGTRLHALDSPIATISVDAVPFLTPTRNVIAETPFGNEDHILCIGAHLDSVATGPGINDNGSGSAAILEVAKQMMALGVQLKNRVRFIWWAAEEVGILGSQFYMDQLLISEKVGNIGLYLNFDMIGSPNFKRAVYNGTESSSLAVEQLFTDYFDSKNLESELQNGVFDRSDHKAFVDAGIPTGGLFTGFGGNKTIEQQNKYGGEVGLAFDPCYHKACDSYENVNLEILDQMLDAIAHAALTYAMSDLSDALAKDKYATFATKEEMFDFMIHNPFLEGMPTL